MNDEGKNLVSSLDDPPCEVILDTDEHFRAKEELMAFHKLWKQLPIVTLNEESNDD